MNALAATQLATSVHLAFTNLDEVLGADQYAALDNLVPPPEMLPSVWAEGNVRIPIGNAIPGPISFDNAPMQRGILDAAREPGMRRMDLMLGAQLGKTTVLQCLVGYHIAHEPCSQILTQPSEGDMATFLETKLRPMLDANPAIANRMAKARGREGVNNSRMVSFVGGWLMFGWAGSPKTARGRSAPKLLMDEVDGYDVTAEGDYPELLAQRSATFGDDALQVRSSTPVDLATSRIYKGWLAGDQRRFYVLCPHCGHRQYFKWENVSWLGRQSKNIEDAEADLKTEDGHDPTTARYRCDADDCGALWDDGERIAALRNAAKVGGGWIASKPFKGHASFHAPEMASTFRRLRDIVQSYLDKLALGDLQSFVNVSLGWPFAAGDKADPDSLYAQRETWVAQVPLAGLYLTAGVDMQIDRLEVEVVAWGFGEESWSVDVHVIWGDPLTSDPWNDLEDYLAGGYRHESGLVLPISATCVDTGGTSGMTAAAYDWLRGRTGRRIFGIKGVGGWGRPIVERPQKKQTGRRKSKLTDLFLVGTDEAKLVVMRRLALKVHGPGFCHFPEDEQHDQDYFKQVTAERLVVRYVKGQAVREWHKNDRDRNEKLDCRVYAYAALKIMQPSFKRIAERMNLSHLATAILQRGGDGQNTPKEPATMQRKPQTPPKASPPVPPPTEAANPQEAAPAPPPQTAAAKPRRKLNAGRKRGTYATNW